MSRSVKVNKAQVQRDIQGVIRTFPTEFVTIRRVTRAYTPLKSATLDFDGGQLVYQGEALHDPGENVLFRFDLGEVKLQNGIRLILTGHRDIRPGDFVQLNAKLHEVRQADDWWHCWMILTLQQYGV